MTGEPSASPSERAASAARNLKIDAVTVEVVRAFEERGIDVLLLKGPTFARWLYDDGRRDYHDTDLLVAPESVSAAEEVLTALGFELPPIYDEGDRPSFDHAWVRRSDKVRVDLHWGLIGARAAPETVWRVLSEYREPIELVLGTVDGLSEPARACQVALHAAQHGSGFSKPLDDLERAVSRLTPDTWHRARDVARSLDAEEAFGAGLRLVPAGEEIAQGLGLVDVAGTETRLRAAGAPELAVSLEWFLSSPGWKGRFRYLLRNLFPSPNFMRDWSSLARRGSLGLLLAYVWRPISLTARLPGALIALRAARRAARQD